MNKPAKNQVQKNKLEWAVFAVSLVLVLATLAFLVRESVVGDGGPPMVNVRLGPSRPTANGYLVPIEVNNVGGATAEDVIVPVLLELGEGKQEEAQLDVAFLPRASTRNGWVSFREDPRLGTLRVGAIAYEAP